MTPDERYLKDTLFKTIVDHFYYLFLQAELTPTEVREAAMLAQIKYEMEHVRPFKVSDELAEILRNNEREDRFDYKSLSKDIRIERFRPKGTDLTASDIAVRITHISAGISVVCDSEYTYPLNRDKALKILKQQLNGQGYIEELNNGEITKDTLEKAYKAGMLKKEQLVSGNYYKGYHRIADVARWSAVSNSFWYVRHKFRDTYVEDAEHPEDDKGYSNFLPIGDTEPNKEERELLEKVQV